ncbi:MAG: VIT and VWA domain-containing protein [Thermoguttaceae bacterium]|nr:VIT and VWA domain-containing protein [Thermoguttaceae bacterium]
MCCLAGALVGLGAAPGHAAGLLIADGGFGGTLEIVEHDVRVTINNGIAVTEVTQVFRNTEDRQVEALYVFPVPKNASVANFSMWIGGKEIIGEVLEKQRAREIYDSYKQVRRDPGLLEQKDYRTFEMRIFPIEARAEQRVQIAYYQELDFDHDWATYVYPLATEVRPGADTATKQFGLSLRLKSEVPIVALESPSHGDQFVVVPHGPSFYEASLESHEANLDRDVVVAFHVARPRTGLDLITSKQPGEDGYFQLTMTAGDELAQAEGGMDYVFVLDISGSMRREDRLEISRDSIAEFIRQLGPDDRFDVMTFNLWPKILFDELRPADAAAQQEATEFLASQQARGGTLMRPAMLAAYKHASGQRPLNVVVLSDGLTDQQERQEIPGLIRSRPEGTRVFCIGVGNDIDRGLLSQMAEGGGGLAAFLSGDDDMQRQAKAFRRKLLRPAADNLRIDLEGAEVYDVEPKQLGSLYHGAPVRIYGRYRQAGPVTVRVQASVAGAPLDRTVEFKLPEANEANPEIERMWAQKKVDRLLAEADAAGSRSPVVDEIVRLGELYSIVTEYTSFIVLENDAEYQRWAIQRRNLLRISRDRKQQTRLNEQLTKMREESLNRLMTHAADGSSADRLAANRDPGAWSPGTGDSRGRDLTPSSGPSSRHRGGGAIDPFSAALLAGLAGLGWAARRRK